MAAGDITAIKELYRQSLGGGQNTTTGSKNNKILTAGEITATYAAAGVSVNLVGGPAAFGVLNIDFIKIEANVIQTASSADDSLNAASYDHANDKIFLLEAVGAASGGAVPSDNDTLTLRYICVGDDASAPEFT